MEADTKARASDKGSQSYDCEVVPMTTVNCRAYPCHHRFINPYTYMKIALGKGEHALAAVISPTVVKY